MTTNPDLLKRITVRPDVFDGKPIIRDKGVSDPEALLNENVGAGYIDRHWPAAFKDTGTWPLTSLRQSFLNGALTRLLDPDAVLRQKVVEFVVQGEFGLASGAKDDGGFNRLWYEESVAAEEVAFEENVFLVTKAKAKELKAVPEHAPQPQPEPASSPEPAPQPEPESAPAPSSANQKTTLRLTGTVPPEVWNRLGTKLLPKLRSGEDLSVGIEFTVRIDSQFAHNMEAELRQVLDDLELAGQVQVERFDPSPDPSPTRRGEP